jgi:hypothetical protein
MTEVVRSHLHFEAVSSNSPFWNGHDSCVVDQNIYFFDLFFDLIRKFFNGVLISEIQGIEDDLRGLVFL